MHMYQKATNKALKCSSNFTENTCGVQQTNKSAVLQHGEKFLNWCNAQHPYGSSFWHGEVLKYNTNELMTDKHGERLANRLNALRVPYDIGRLPKTMLEKMSARGLKAQQWKNFIVTYARVCLWNIVPHTLYDSTKCLGEVVELLLKDPITKHEVNQISDLLHKKGLQEVLTERNLYHLKQSSKFRRK